jgi:transcriptional regulator with XRE-family HTH domain
MRLPEVAERLRQLAIKLGCDELNDLADEIGRRPIRQRAPTTSARMTSAVRAQIKAMKAAEPDLSQHEIARRLNLNPGRVSETLRGKRS